MNELSTSSLFSTGDRRAMLLGLGVVLLVIAFARGYPVWRDRERKVIGEAERNARDVARLAAAVRSLPAARDSVAARTVRLARLRSAVIMAPSSVDAGAALLAHVSRIIDENQVRVVSMSLHSTTARSAGTLPVAIRVSILSGIEQLVQLLRAVEDAPLLLAVRELSIEPAGATPDSLHEELRVHLTVEALARVGEPSPRYAGAAAP